VFIDGEKSVTLRGGDIAREFVAIIDGYVERHYGQAANAD
jgi:(E)-4-hydroxy-3-methylbut-2-enyl-diphosphate synthase